MEPVKWLTSALGATAATKTFATAEHVPAAGRMQEAGHKPALPDNFDWSHFFEMLPPQNMPLAQVQHAFHARSTGGALSTRNNFCLDVTDGNFKNGQAPQIWACSANDANQQWSITNGQLQTGNGMCLDLPNGYIYPGAPLQLWQCSNGNRNQQWQIAQSSIQKTGTNYCLDVRDGHYNNGAAVQLWPCDWNYSGGNQVFKFGSTPVPAVNNPSSFLNYPTISWDKFIQLNPECAPYSQAMISAASANNLVPTLLGAVALTESSCNANVNQWGLFQFSDDGAWAQYGGASANRMNPTDATWGAARYLRALLNQDNQNLDQALRDYNGPLSQGGNPQYQNEIRMWMSGGNPWNAGI